MTAVTNQLGERSAIIVAHPDDEVLWFSSVLAKVNDVVIIFNDYLPMPELGLGRKQALENYPLASLISLGLNESVSYDKAQWPNPEITDYGVKLQDTECDDNYRRKFDETVKALSSYLSSKRPTTIFTHNPWGEYGHEDHIQVYRALRALQHSFGFKLFVSCYSHDKTENLMLQEINKLSATALTGQPNEPLYQQLKELYQASGVWTWQNHYSLPQQEFFFAIEDTLKAATKNDLKHTIKLGWPTDEKTVQPTPKPILRRFREYVRRAFNV